MFLRTAAGRASGCAVSGQRRNGDQHHGESNQANAPVFPKTFASGSVIPSGTQNLIYASNKLRDPRTQQATLALERRLNKDTTLTLSVLNSRGLKFWSATDTNLATPSKTETYTIDNAKIGRA